MLKKQGLLMTVLALFLVSAIPAFSAPGPGDPKGIFGVSYAALVKDKGAGKEIYRTDKAGEKKLVGMSYNETWFGLPGTVRANYFYPGSDSKNIRRVNLRFPKGTDRQATIDQIARSLGQPTRAGVPDNATPKGKAENRKVKCEYRATWLKDGVSYTLSDYGKFIVMGVKPQ